MATPKSENIWANAIRKAVHDYGEIEDDEGIKKKERNINILAAVVVASAKKGDMGAIKEIGDRLDGKAHQSIGGADGGPVALAVSWLRHDA